MFFGIWIQYTLQINVHKILHCMFKYSDRFFSCSHQNYSFLVKLDLWTKLSKTFVSVLIIQSHNTLANRHYV